MRRSRVAKINLAVKELELPIAAKMQELVARGRGLLRFHDPLCKSDSRGEGKRQKRGCQ